MQNHSYDIYVFSFKIINMALNPEYYDAIQAKIDSFNNTQPVDRNFFTFIKTVSLDNLDGIYRTGCTTLNADIVNKSLYTRERDGRLQRLTRAFGNDITDDVYIQPEYSSNLSERICLSYNSVANKLDIYFPDNQENEEEISDIFYLELKKWELPSGGANGKILLYSKLHENNSWDLLNPSRQNRSRRNSSNVSRISNFSFNNKSTAKRSRKSTKISLKSRKNRKTRKTRKTRKIKKSKKQSRKKSNTHKTRKSSKTRKTRKSRMHSKPRDHKSKGRKSSKRTRKSKTKRKPKAK